MFKYKATLASKKELEDGSIDFDVDITYTRADKEYLTDIKTAAAHVFEMFFNDNPTPVYFKSDLRTKEATKTIQYVINYLLESLPEIIEEFKNNNLNKTSKEDTG